METSTTQVSGSTNNNSGGRGGPTINTDFIKSLTGILLIVILVVDLCALICTGVGYIWGGSGFCIFVEVLTFGIVAIIFVLNLLTMLGKLPGPWNLILLIYFAVSAVLFFICFIILCVYAAQTYWFKAANGFGAFFCLALLALFGVLAFFQFRKFQSEGPNVNGTPKTASQGYDNEAGQPPPQQPPASEGYDPTMYGGGAQPPETY